MFRLSLGFEDNKALDSWRKLLNSYGKLKKIPSGLLPIFVNEFVHKWMNENNFEYDECRYLTRIFPVSSWDSFLVHKTKVACLLCAHIPAYNYETAMVRVEESEFMKFFLLAHFQDKIQDLNTMNQIDVLQSIFEGNLKYSGRSIQDFYVNFYIDHANLFAFHATCEM